MKARIIGFSIVAVIGMIIAFNMITEQRKLPVINPIKIDEHLVDKDLQSKMSGHRIPSFELVDQHGVTLTEKQFEGKIYIADFFFTTCPGICKQMVSQMSRIQNTYKDRNDFAILSHTVQPEADSVPVLNEYAELNEVRYGFWYLATGERSHINDLARKAYFAAKLEEGEKEDAMVHTENFVLVDKEKRIRGIYDGTSTEEVDQLIEDIEILYAEYE